MATVSKEKTFTDGAVPVAADFNKNFDNIYNEFNGNIDNSNIKSNAAIAGSKLADAGVIGGKLNLRLLQPVDATLSGSGQAVTSTSYVDITNASGTASLVVGEKVVIIGSISAYSSAIGSSANLRISAYNPSLAIEYSTIEALQFFNVTNTHATTTTIHGMFQAAVTGTYTFKFQTKKTQGTDIKFDANDKAQLSLFIF